MERLKLLMEQKKLSKYRIAKDLHITDGAVRSWLKGRTKPRDDSMEKLALYFGVSPAWLKYGEQQYAPTLRDEVMQLAEEMNKFVARRPEELSKLKSVVRILIGGERDKGDRETSKGVTVSQGGKKRRRRKAA